MRLKKSVSCTNCESHLFCSIYKGVQSHVDVANRLQMLDLEGNGEKTPVLWDVYRALAGACLFFRKIDWNKYPPKKVLGS